MVNRSIPLELAFAAGGGEHGDQLVHRPEDLRHMVVKRLDHLGVVVAAGLVVPHLAYRIPPGAGGLLGVVELPTATPELHDEPSADGGGGGTVGADAGLAA